MVHRRVFADSVPVWCRSAVSGRSQPSTSVASDCAFLRNVSSRPTGGSCLTSADAHRRGESEQCDEVLREWSGEALEQRAWQRCRVHRRQQSSARCLPPMVESAAPPARRWSSAERHGRSVTHLEDLHRRARVYSSLAVRRPQTSAGSRLSCVALAGSSERIFGNVFVPVRSTSESQKHHHESGDGYLRK